jgi:hypothetical protein
MTPYQQPAIRTVAIATARSELAPRYLLVVLPAGQAVRLSAVLLASLTALAMPAASAAAAQRAATLVMRVSPVTSTGELKSGYTVAHRYSGARCQSDSSVTGSAYRCFSSQAPDGVYDPCWVTQTSDNVVCIGRPWARRVVQLAVTQGYDDTDPMRTSATPWGAQLTDGNRCLFQPGSVHSINGRPLRYYCHHHVVLAGQFDRSHRQWQIRSYKDVTPNAADATYRWQGFARVNTASYGVASRRA